LAVRVINPKLNHVYERHMVRVIEGILVVSSLESRLHRSIATAGYNTRKEKLAVSLKPRERTRAGRGEDTHTNHTSISP
jgi:hypothetical protein